VGAVTAYAAAERRALCDLFREVGASAPTLCEGWDAHHLAAHLWVREHRLDAIPGFVLGGAAAAHAEARMDEARRRFGFHALVEQLRQGPPPGPYKLPLPGAEDLANLHELFVHHEDVRRPSGLGPRDLDAGMARALWLRLRVAAPVLFRRARVRVALVRPDGEAMWGAYARGRPVAKVHGPVGELFLYAFGRKDAADVDLRGDDEAVARLSAAPLGV
jgi:uncharacterized protein (TIGR03085 family)